MSLLSYLPYFPDPTGGNPVDETKINHLHLFNFRKHGDAYIVDQDLRAAIGRFCGMYVDESRQPLDQLTISVIDDNYTFNNLSDDQIKDMQRYIGALLFCSVIQNRTNGAWASENFTLFHQNFGVAQDHISYTAGSYARLDHTIEIAEKRFIKPDFVPHSTFYSYDEDLLKGFANMIDAHDPADDRLFMTLDWIRHALSNTDGFSGEIRLAMLCTAFEVFFDLPESDKERLFAEQLEDLLDVSEMNIPTLSRMKKNGKPTSARANTIYGWWARDFYWARSEVVHKGSLSREDFSNHNNAPHMTIALRMMKFCFYSILEKRVYLTYEPVEGAPDLSKILNRNRLRKIEELIK